MLLNWEKFNINVNLWSIIKYMNMYNVYGRVYIISIIIML